MFFYYTKSLSLSSIVCIFHSSISKINLTMLYLKLFMSYNSCLPPGGNGPIGFS